MSNFQCPQCGMVNIDCGKDGYKTPKELQYEKALDEIEKIVNEPCVADTQEDCKHCDIWCEHKDILNIINKAKAEEDKQ